MYYLFIYSRIYLFCAVFTALWVSEQSPRFYVTHFSLRKIFFRFNQPHDSVFHETHTSLGSNVTLTEFLPGKDLLCINSGVIYASPSLRGHHTLLNYAKPFMQAESVAGKNIATYFATGNTWLWNIKRFGGEYSWYGVLVGR